MDPFEKQKEFLELSGDQLAFFGGRQAGKTTALAMRAVQEMKDGYNIGVRAPNRRVAFHLIEAVKDMCNPSLARTDRVATTSGNIEYTEDINRGYDAYYFEELSGPELERCVSTGLTVRYGGSLRQVDSTNFNAVYAASFDNPLVSPMAADDIYTLEHIKIDNHVIFEKDSGSDVDLICEKCSTSITVPRDDQLLRRYARGYYRTENCI